MCVVTKESNPKLYNALFEDENSEISIEIMNKRGQEIFDELKNVLDKKDKEIQRLNNIIEELEQFLEHRLSCSINGIRDDEIRKAMNKLKELKEGK